MQVLNVLRYVDIHVLRHLFLTFRRTIRSCHDNNSIQEQILKKLLENHGISDISDLKHIEDRNELLAAAQLRLQTQKMHRDCQAHCDMLKH